MWCCGPQGTPTPLRSAEHVLVFRQTAGTYKDKDTWRNTGTPLEDNFSILDQLETFRRADGTFLLKIVFPELAAPNYNIWKQTSNPVEATSRGVTGYEAVDIHFTGNYWGGLEYSDRTQTLLDGSVDHGNWFYAVGTTLAWSGGMPGPDGTISSKTELYALLPGRHLLRGWAPAGAGQGRRSRGRRQRRRRGFRKCGHGGLQR